MFISHKNMDNQPTFLKNKIFLLFFPKYTIMGLKNTTFFTCHTVCCHNYVIVKEEMLHNFIIPRIFKFTDLYPYGSLLLFGFKNFFALAGECSYKRATHTHSCVIADAQTRPMTNPLMGNMKKISALKLRQLMIKLT